MPRDDRLRWMMWMSVCGMETMIIGLGMGRLVHPFIRLRRRPRALPVEECVKGVGANPEPRYHCFGGFRHWRITLRSLGACVPKRFGAHGRRRVFLWRYHGLSPWGSIIWRLKRVNIQSQVATGQCDLLRTPAWRVSRGMGDRPCRATRSLPRRFISAVRQSTVPPQGFSEDHTGPFASHFFTFVRMVTGKGTCLLTRILIVVVI
jgi:hypothetical protein